jgi:hypothetical protein
MQPGELYYGEGGVRAVRRAGPVHALLLSRVGFPLQTAVALLHDQDDPLEQGWGAAAADAGPPLAELDVVGQRAAALRRANRVGLAAGELPPSAGLLVRARPAGAS